MLKIFLLFFNFFLLAFCFSQKSFALSSFEVTKEKRVKSSLIKRKSLYKDSKLNFSSLSSRINAYIKKSKIKPNHLGIYIAPLVSKKKSILFKNKHISINEGKLFIPASLTKISTAATVLKRIGLKKRFTTRLVSERPAKKGVLHGDLFLVGGGDPGFTSESMWKLVNDFLRSQIKEVRGRIVVDDSLFTKERYPSGRSPIRVHRAYDAPIGAMSFNWNVGNIYIKPSPKLGEPAIIYAGPYPGYYKIKNKTKTVRGSLKKISATSFKLANPIAGEREQLIIRGTIGIRSKEKVHYQKIEDPDFWSGQNLKWFLASRGVKVLGGVTVGKAPVKNVVLAKQESQPLSFSIYQLMKYSNNLVAEILTKHLSLIKNKKATEQGGIQEIESYLSSIGLEKGKDFLIKSSSGLSKLNKFKPIAIFKIIQDMNRSPDIYPEFLSALSISGLDGSLKNRMHNPLLAHWLRGKTGTLRGVIGLSGVIHKEMPMGVVFIFNGAQKNSLVAEKLFTQISAEITRYSP